MVSEEGAAVLVPDWPGMAAAPGEVLRLVLVPGLVLGLPPDIPPLVPPELPPLVWARNGTPIVRGIAKRTANISGKLTVRGMDMGHILCHANSPQRILVPRVPRRA
jgi:hypothetical protein